MGWCTQNGLFILCLTFPSGFILSDILSGFSLCIQHILPPSTQYISHFPHPHNASHTMHLTPPPIPTPYTQVWVGAHP